MACACAIAVAQAAGGFRIAGRVVDSVSGEPLPRVTMSLLTEEDYHLITSVVTDADGRFAFQGVPAGKYPLSGARRGYRTSAYDEHDGFSSAIVTGEGQQTDDLVFRLDPGAILRGVVTGDDGDPVEHGQVMLFKHGSEETAGERMEQAGATDTDDNGAYEFSGLAPGEYYLAVKGEPWFAVHPPGGDQRPSPLDVAYPITYFDSTTDQNAATPVTLAAGSHEEADINLHAVPALRLRFAVPWSPQTGPRVALQQTIFGNAVAANVMNMTSSPGLMEISGIAPGSYDVEIGDPPRRIALNASQSTDVDASAAMPTLTVSGTLVMAGGGPVPEGVGVALMPLEGGHSMFPAFARKGHFEVSGVTPGKWSLNAGVPNGVLFVASVSQGGVSSAGSTIVVKDRPLTLTVTLSNSQTRVRGFARRDGKGMAGVMVVLVPKDPGAFPVLARRDQSDSDGSFSLRDVAAGQYTVVAIEDAWKLEWEKREVIAKYLPRGVAVTVPAQAGATVTLEQPVAVQER